MDEHPQKYKQPNGQDELVIDRGKSGLGDALLHGQRTFLPAERMIEQEAGYLFEATIGKHAIHELWDASGWSDPTYAAVLSRFGEMGVIDLVCTVGYYTTLAMVMNVARTDAPGGFRMPRLP